MRLHERDSRTTRSARSNSIFYLIFLPFFFLIRSEERFQKQLSYLRARKYTISNHRNPAINNGVCPVRRPKKSYFFHEQYNVMEKPIIEKSGLVWSRTHGTLRLRFRANTKRILRFRGPGNVLFTF